MNYSFFNKWTPIFMEKLMKDFDLSELDAAAIFGNAGHESGGYKSLQEKKPLVKGSRGGYGIMQWTGPRRRSYEAYCKRNNLDPADMNSNYKFLFVELQGPEGKALTYVKRANTLKSKTKAFSDKFLRPGIPHMNSRYIWAERALKAWKDRTQYETYPDPSVDVEGPKVEKTKSFWNWLFSLLKRSTT